MTIQSQAMIHQSPKNVQGQKRQPSPKMAATLGPHIRNESRFTRPKCGIVAIFVASLKGFFLPCVREIHAPSRYRHGHFGMKKQTGWYTKLCLCAITSSQRTHTNHKNKIATRFWQCLMLRSTVSLINIRSNRTRVPDPVLVWKHGDIVVQVYPQQTVCRHVILIFA